MRQRPPAYRSRSCLPAKAIRRITRCTRIEYVAGDAINRHPDDADVDAYVYETSVCEDAADADDLGDTPASDDDDEDDDDVEEEVVVVEAPHQNASNHRTKLQLKVLCLLI